MDKVNSLLGIFSAVVAQIASLGIDWVSGGSLTPHRRTFFVQATLFLMDLSLRLSSLTTGDKMSFDVLRELFVGQSNSESVLEWPSNLDEDLQQYNKELFAFRFRMMNTIWHRVLFQTANGHIGLGSPGTKVDDDICLLMGYPASVMLQKVESHYIVIGECFALDLTDIKSVKDMLKSPQGFEIH